MRIAAGLLLVLTGLAATAEAQPMQGTVRGFGGVTFMSETAGIVGMSVGVQVRPRLEIFAEGGRLTNVLPHSLQRDLDDVARSFGNYYGAPLRIDGRAPAVYGLAGVRLSHQVGTRARIYIDAGAGSARGTSDISARAGGRDVSTSVVAALGIKKSETGGLIAAGGGFMVEVTRRLGFEMGYRFMRIFTDDPRINTANMSAGLRWGF
jgi:opacity protein-like surface antigen